MVWRSIFFYLLSVPSWARHFLRDEKDICVCDCDCGRWWYNFCIWLLKQLVCVWERIIVGSLKWNELTETLTIQIRRGLPAAAARTYKKDVDVTTSTWMVHWWMQRHRVQRSAIEPPGNGSQFRKDCSFLVKLIGKCLHKKVIHKLICLGCTVDSSCSCRLGPKSTGHLWVL